MTGYSDRFRNPVLFRNRFQNYKKNQYLPSKLSRIPK